MADLDFREWNESYVQLLAKYPQGSEEHNFFKDAIATINQMIDNQVDFEARLTALEP